ncbi:AAA family ATPase [Oribacterium sp. oral taxon 102]|uniref:ATP-dependent DNA helicase n=1 Tax=Oribacterium sp. oral taxon 102 TaxID=671214 RepID=UPI0015BEBC47|nr:AAA family ATPase [Oribacterium sp. oral taxon 102]NWO21345.1 AAA family ATPase [Oribacterium sp. oral taxon 102]
MRENVKLSADQEAAFQIMEAGENCFLTGKAGTGKSLLIKKFIGKCKDDNKNVIVCASTGAAAQGLSEFYASTIHRAFGLKAKGIVGLPKKAKEEIISADVIIIDEISMARIDLFEHVAKAVQLASDKKNHDEAILAKKEGRDPDHKPIQLIVVGDFTQLPPVVTINDRDAMKSMFGSKKFAFQSKLWGEMQFQPLVLTQVHRQDKDQEYAERLNAIRRCDIGNDPFGEVLDWFNLNTAKKEFNTENSIILCGKNATAKEENEKRINEIDGSNYVSVAEIDGDADMASVNCEYELVYKPGAKVLIIANNPDSGYFNGSSGIIKKCGSDKYGDYVIVDIYGQDGTIKSEDVEVRKNVFKVNKPFVEESTIEELDAADQPIIRTVKTVKNKEVGSIKQFPFKLGWAITIHKAQGMTLTSGVNLKPEIWDSGQLYVALSRVDNRENIYIDGLLDIKNWKLDPAVAKFYEKIDKEWA